MIPPKCPICGKPTEAGYRPFCSKRCADVDLQRWFSGRYAVPAVEAEEDGGEDPSDA
ncbi:MAG: DNA gyrase inhibitor YacG [Phenylobacterium sp.]|nr:MAG: DNA gyrase inhibitor YacG [Phenylobacterium sp.]